MKKHSASLLILMLALFCSGCLPLPYPHQRLHANGVKGQVVSAADERAIPGALITSTAKPKESCRTGPDGTFRLRPVYGWHGAILIGPISYSLLPFMDVPSMGRTIRVSAAGYTTATLTVRVTFPFSERPANHEDRYLNAGTVRLAPLK